MATPADGFGAPLLAAATLPSSSGRGARLFGELPIGFAPVAAGWNSGDEAAGLEPRSETPRKTVPLPEDEGGTFTPGPAGTPGGEDAAVGEVGGGEAAVGETGGTEPDDGVGDDAGVPRQSGGLDVMPGVETGCPGGMAVVPAVGAVVLVGCQPDGDDVESG